MNEVKTCNWNEDESEFGIYYTSCENVFHTIEGTYKDNGFMYCPFCGGKIK